MVTSSRLWQREMLKSGSRILDPCFLNPTSAAGNCYAVGSMSKMLWVNTGTGDPTSLLHRSDVHLNKLLGSIFSLADQFPQSLQQRGSFC